MSTTPSELDIIGEIVPTDRIMLTHSDESTECINGQNLKKDVGGISFIPNCTTANNLSEKEVTGPKITLENGVTIEVFFTTGNVSQTPTLNYNNTGAKSIMIMKGGNKVAASINPMDAGTILRLRYDGTDWVICGNPVVKTTNDYTSYADGTIEYRSKYENPSAGIYAGRLKNNQFYIDISMSRTVENQRIFEVLTLPVNARPRRNFFVRASGWIGTGSAWIEKTAVLFYVQTDGKVSGCANFDGVLDICGSAIISD